MSSNDHTWPKGHDHYSFWPNPSHYDPTSKIMLAAVISSSAVIFFIFTLYLYARLVLHRRREEATFRGLPVVLRHPFQTPKRGLDATVIASLPTFTVGANGGDVEAASECVVCLSVLEEQDMVRELPNCKHVFHVDCVDTWLATCSTCPVCRKEVQPRLRLEPETRERPVGDGATPPSLEDVRMNSLSVSRLDSFRRILTRERSLNRTNHSCVDQEPVV